MNSFKKQEKYSIGFADITPNIDHHYVFIVFLCTKSFISGFKRSSLLTNIGNIVDCIVFMTQERRARLPMTSFMYGTCIPYSH